METPEEVQRAAANLRQSQATWFDAAKRQWRNGAIGAAVGALLVALYVASSWAGLSLGNALMLALVAGLLVFSAHCWRHYRRLARR